MEAKLNISARFANMSILSAIMVVIIHVLKRDQAFGSLIAYVRLLTGEGICRIAVPFFFMAAGYFVARHVEENGYWLREVKKRIVTLVIPFVTWCLICFILCSVMMISLNVCHSDVWHKGVFSLSRILRASGLNPFCVPELRQLWFVRVLFLFVLMLPLFSAYLRRFGVGGLLLAFMVYLLMKPFAGIILGDKIGTLVNFGCFSFEGAAYFSLGIWLMRSKKEWIFSFKRVGCVALVFALLLMMVRNRFGVFSSVVFFSSIPFALYGLLTLVPDAPFKFLRGYSFPIYLIHLNVIFVYFFALDYLCPTMMLGFFDPGKGCVGAFVAFVIVFGSSVLFASVLKRGAEIFPKLGLILFGGRK